MKSPFIIERDFISPHMCEDIIDSLNFILPDVNINGTPIPSLKYNEDLEKVIFDILQKSLPNFEEYFNVKYKGTSDMTFEYLPTGCKNIPAVSGNSSFINGKWVKTKNNDFTGIIFLTDYNDRPPFSDEFEVYGGKLEFKQHDFGFNPERGTMILFPSAPNFLYKFSDVLVGNGYFIKFNITCKENFVYNRLKFPGNYLTWFQEMA